MALTNAGRDFIAAKVHGFSGTVFDNTNCYLGVGDSATAFAGAQTDLQAATNKLRRVMDATFPQQAANVITLQSTFGTADANWVWNEFGSFNAAAAGTMLQRKVSALGTKVSGQTWQFQVVLTYSNP